MLKRIERLRTNFRKQLMPVLSDPFLYPVTKNRSKTFKLGLSMFQLVIYRQVTFQNFIRQRPSLFEPLLPHRTLATGVAVDMSDKVSKDEWCRMQSFNV